MLRTVLFAFAALCCVATTTNVAFDPNLLLRVQMEDTMSRAMVDLSLKLRQSMQLMSTASLYSQVLNLEFQERRKSLEEEADGENDFNLENESFIQRELEENGSSNTLFGEGKESDRKQSQLLTHAAHELLHATKLKFYQTVLKSREVQANFWLDRYVQLQVLSAGAQANPQILQFLYMKMYRTNLETMRLALTFQYLAHFVSWVEDELDVQSGLTRGDQISIIIAEDQGKDLIRDKLWAFSTYHSAASIELQAYYLDLFLTYAGAPQPALFQAPSANAANSNANAAFLEEEVSEQANPTEAQNQFFPFMAASAATAGNQNPMVFMTYLKLYYLMIQYGGAKAALTSVFAEKLAYEKNPKTTPEQLIKYREFAQNMFGGEFARYLSMGANIKYMTTIWEWYMIMFAQYQQPAQPAQQTTPTTTAPTNPQ